MVITIWQTGILTAPYRSFCNNGAAEKNRVEKFSRLVFQFFSYIDLVAHKD